MSVATLHIRRWRNEILVAREHREPPRVRARFDELTAQLVDTLASDSQAWFNDQDEQVILMRRLELDCELDLSRTSEDLLRRWRPRFARALLDAIAGGDAQIMRWPSLAAYRARYIHDLACGNATDVWYYRSFEGLQSLPAASAIRTLLTEDGTLGRATLVLLDPGAWRHLALILTAREAERILDALASDGGTSFDLDRAVAVARDATETSVSTIPPVRALHLFALALRAQLPPARTLMQWLRVVAHATCFVDRAEMNGFIEALRSGDLATLMRLEPGAEPQTWSWLERPGWRETVIDQLRTHATDAQASSLGDQRSYSGLAGVVLLLGELDALLDDAVCEQLPASDVAVPRALAAWLALACSCGKDRIHAFLRDGLWREFFDLPPTLDGNTIGAWLDEHPAEPALAALSRRAASLARGNVLLVPLPSADSPVTVEIDSSTGLWLRFTSERNDAATGAWRTRLRLARLTRSDARFLDASLPLPSDWARFFTQCAQVVLRRFAYRLPGFACTSLPHLQANVFAMPGSWDAEQARMQLTRPPLYPLLNLTGMARGSITWHGPPVRNVCLDFNA